MERRQADKRGRVPLADGPASLSPCSAGEIHRAAMVPPWCRPMAQAPSARNRCPQRYSLGAGTGTARRRCAPLTWKRCGGPMSARSSEKDRLPRFDPVEVGMLLLGVVALTAV